jgi:ribosome-associated protein
VIDKSEIKFTFICSPGPGGQNVNKVATAVLLRFNVQHSPSLSDDVRARLLAIVGNKITNEGDLLIKASRYRTQEKNKMDALERLAALIKRAKHVPKKRKKTKPTLASKTRRLDSKKIHSKTKALRQTKHRSSE